MVAPELLGPLDVAVLRALVAAAEQDYKGLALAAEVHAVARTEVDAQLVNTFADGLGITEVAQPQASNAGADSVAGRPIAKPTQPLGERFAAVRAGVDPDLLLGRHPGIVA